MIGTGAAVVVLIIAISATREVGNGGKETISVPARANTSNASIKAAPSNSIGQGHIDLPIGATVQWHNNGAVQNITLLSMNNATYAVSSYGQPPRNGRFAIATFSITQVWGSGNVSPLNFEWIRDDGTHDQADPTVGTLDSGTLQVGQTAKGTVDFDTRAGAGTIRFTGGLAQTASWVIPRR